MPKHIPRPVPPPLLELKNWQNGSKRRFLKLSVMPHPVSDTQNSSTIRPPSASCVLDCTSVTSTCPDSRVNFTAFPVESEIVVERRGEVRGERGRERDLQHSICIVCFGLDKRHVHLPQFSCEFYYVSFFW
jgi:hypothetical protein